MAGIGFELRRLLQRRTYASFLAAFGTAGLIGAGPLAVSVVGIFAVGLLTSAEGVKSGYVQQFQVATTYLMAASLIFTSPLQLLLTRFSADCFFSNERERIVPNLIGGILIVTIGGGSIAAVLLTCCFSGSWSYRVLMMLGFVLLNSIWLLMTVLSSIRAWRTVLVAFVIGYSVTVGVTYQLHRYALEGMLFGFIVGQSLLFLVLFVAIVRSYPSGKGPLFEFIQSARNYSTLAVTGLLYNIGIWADKIIFWSNPLTGEEIIYPLRHSPIYDTPIFLAYLSIIPGMAIFLLRVETDFAEKYELYYGAIREGTTLTNLAQRKAEMVSSIRDGIYDLVKVQGVFVAILIWGGGFILQSMGISLLQQPLFNVFVVAVGLQVLVLSINNVLYWFDWRLAALMLTLFFTLANILLTELSIVFGAAYYGYGFAAALLLSSVLGIFILRHKLSRLEYETFMLQKVQF